MFSTSTYATRKKICQNVNNSKMGNRTMDDLLYFSMGSFLNLKINVFLVLLLFFFFQRKNYILEVQLKRYNNLKIRTLTSK